MKHRLFSALSAVGIGLASLSLAPLASAQSERWEARSEVDDAISTLLREGRGLERDAKIAGDYNVVNAIRDLMVVARPIKIAVDANTPASELRRSMPDLLAKIKGVGRAVDDSSAKRSLTGGYDAIKRSYNYLASLIGDNGRFPNPEPAGNGKRVIATVSSAFKSSTEQSFRLPPTQKCVIPKDEILLLAPQSEPLKRTGHVRVTLAAPIAGCAFGYKGNTGYLYAPHFKDRS